MSLSLADLFRAEARAGTRSSHKAVINIFLGGGPPHQDTWEIKTEAPAEIRGEFKPIATKVPGIDICEVFPQLAGLMDKAAVIRSIVGAAERHDAFQCNTGWLPDNLQSIGGRPSLGAMVSKLQGPSTPPSRRSSVWPRELGTAPGPTRVPLGFSGRLSRPSSRTGRQWPT